MLKINYLINIDLALNKKTNILTKFTIIITIINIFYILIINNI